MPGSGLERREDPDLGLAFWERANLKKIPVGQPVRTGVPRVLRGAPWKQQRGPSQSWEGPAPTLGFPPQLVQRGFLEAYRE